MQGETVFSSRSKSLKCYNINGPSKPIKHLDGSGPPARFCAATSALMLGAAFGLCSGVQYIKRVDLIWNILTWITT